MPGEYLPQNLDSRGYLAYSPPHEVPGLRHKAVKLSCRQTVLQEMEYLRSDFLQEQALKVHSILIGKPESQNNAVPKNVSTKKNSARGTHHSLWL